MPKPARARDRITNWFAYNATLRKLGEMLIWFDKDTTWLAPYEVRAGRPRLFPDSVPILLTRKPH